ncbi:hypothetical protein Tco_1132498 [Tanacetum coccineum]|uniref:Reverse transcriptase n=1 Tax=Tanacetum coccineum TaxID=301880 RepID=A0ABQ5JC32_9ASTR
MDTVLVEGSEVRAEEVIPDEEEVEVDAIPLATKPPSIVDYKIIKEGKIQVLSKHGYTRPEEGYERVLWGDLKIMFEHHAEDLVWRNLQGKQSKRCPLTPATITEMLNKKLQADD